MSSISPAAARIPGDGRSLRLSRLGDELLARQATRGSERAFSALYERYYQPLYRYCRSIVRDDADAQDALQSTFTSALAALQRDGRNAPLRPWLYRIAHNESISLLRRRRRDAPQETVGETTAVGASAEEEAASRARWQRVVTDLAELPERQRGSLLLRELAGLSHEEIALTFGTSVGAAKQAIFEARQGLAELEEGRAMSCHEVRARISEGDRRLLRGRRVNAHLRDCAACEAFAAAIPARQSELRALAPLPPVAAAALLSRVIRGATPHGGVSAGSAATAAGIGKTAGTVVGWKALATVGVLAGTAAGVTGLTHVLHHAAPAGSAAPAAVVKPAHHGSSTARAHGGSGDRSATAQPAVNAKRSAARAHSRASAPVGRSGKHHRGGSHSHGAVQSGSGPGAGVAASRAASNSQAADGHTHSAWGQLSNRGVRRHGSTSTAHAPRAKTHTSSQRHAITQTHRSGQTHRSSQVHTTSRTQTTAAPTVSLHATSSVSHTGGSATGVVKTTTSPTSSATVTPPHSGTGTGSK